MTKIDFLLLNASNYPKQPIYPYAFVQLSALARRRGLSVRRHDFLGIPKQDWADAVNDLISSCRPRMVGFHLRQADSQFLDEYASAGRVMSPRQAYFPVDDTKLLIEHVRCACSVPIVVGGFGFSVQAARIFEFLQPDFGVCGAPEGFLDFFDQLAQRDVSSACVANLVYRSADRTVVGPIAHSAPFDDPEYDDEIFAEICSFYARHGRSPSVGRVGEVDFPIEVMRGCPCHCYFCTEPFVKGRKVQRRNLDAVMKDVAFLAARDVRCVWFICSEINMGGMDFALQLAGRMKEFNIDRGIHRVLWKAYAMPRPGMSREEMRFMMSAGYIPGWNEFTSFDDANLKACGMPYRASHAVTYLRNVLELSQDVSTYHGPPLRKFEMFLGNAFMTASSMQATMAVVDREGFGQLNEFGGAITATRVYETNGNFNCGTEDTVFSIGPDGPMPAVDVVRPTFHYAPDLLLALGDTESVETFLGFVGRTCLTTGYRSTFNLLDFVRSAISPSQLEIHLRDRSLVGLITMMHLSEHQDLLSVNKQEIPLLSAAQVLAEKIWRQPSEVLLSEILSPLRPQAATSAMALSMVLDVLFKLNAEPFARILEYLGLAAPQDRATPYRIMKVLYKQFDTNAQVVAELSKAFGITDHSLDVFQLKHFLCSSDVRIEAAYGPLLFGGMPDRAMARS